MNGICSTVRKICICYIQYTTIFTRNSCGCNLRLISFNEKQKKIGENLFKKHVRVLSLQTWDLYALLRFSYRWRFHREFIALLQLTQVYVMVMVYTYTNMYTQYKIFDIHKVNVIEWLSHLHVRKISLWKLLYIDL